jgi:hypothetical protein
MARQLGKNACDSARHRFTIQRLLRDMDDLYTQLLAEKAISVRAPKKLVGSEVV